MSPASPASNVFLNVSIPVIVVGIGFLLIPIKWTSSLTLHLPYSTVPVTTVPLPEMFIAPSTDIKKSLSNNLSGNSNFSSIALISFSIDYIPISGSESYNAHKALPLTKTVLSPSYSY